MKRFLIEDLPKMTYVNSARWNCIGTQAAYVVKSHDVSHNQYKNVIWLYDQASRKSRQLTYTGKEADFIWDSEETLLLMTDREQEEETTWPHSKSSFYRLPVNGGEAYKVFDLTVEAERIEKISDGVYAVLALTDLRQAEYEAMSEEEQKEEQDYHVFEEVPFWGNGRGYIAGKRHAIYLYEEESKCLKQITPANMDVADFDIKEKKLVYIGKTWDTVIPFADGVYEYDCKQETTKIIVPQETYQVSHAAYLGEDILITATDSKLFGLEQNHWFYLFHTDTKALELIAENTVYIGCNTLSDSMGSGSTFEIAGEKAYYVAQTGADNSIFSIDRTGKRECVLAFEGSIGCLDVMGNQLLISANAKDNASELYLVTEGNAQLVTNFNQELLKERYVASAIYEPFTNRDGIQVDGWVLPPIDYDEKGSYPAILEIHGGPRCAYGTSFFHEMQIFASAGYFVFFCNPRGSDGYGEEFADLREKYGSIDYNDLMDFTDHILARYPQIDAKRLGAAGGSYGGFMCNWIEGHTDRFGAICSQRSISDWVADFGNSEIGILFDQNEMGANPWTDVQKMWDVSPLKYACHAKTPILFIHSLQDYNCTLDQGAAMFTAMKYFGVPSRMCIFEGENHSLSRSGKPKHRMRRLREMMNWFDRYLKKQEET